VALRTDSLDLGRLKLTSGEGRSLQLHVGVDAFMLGGQRYEPVPAMPPVRLDVSRMTGNGYALRLRFEARVQGPCMRCLEPAAPAFAVDARDVWQPGAGEELESPYVEDGVLDLQAWARDALALTLPPQLLCRPECLGLCTVCGADLNTAGPDHHHEQPPDPRWAKLSEIRFQ
jgi:uncharacterized protein